MCLYSQSTAGPQSSPLESPFKITARLEASAESNYISFFCTVKYTALWADLLLLLCCGSIGSFFPFIPLQSFKLRLPVTATLCTSYQQTWLWVKYWWHCSTCSTCENVLPESNDVLCLRCECKFESRNSALIAVSLERWFHDLKGHFYVHLMSTWLHWHDQWSQAFSVFTTLLLLCVTVCAD